MRRTWGRVVGVAVVFALVTGAAGCSHDLAKVSFFGDSELDHASHAVLSDQGTNHAVRTVLYPESGCGLMVDGSPTGLRYHYCNQNRNDTQRRVDTFWRSAITTDRRRGLPKYVEVELGVNDAGWHTVAELADYKVLVEQFISWLPPGVPVLWDNLPEMSPSTRPQTVAIDRALTEAAAETPNLHIVDIRAAFAGHWPEWFLSDQVHFNNDGAKEFGFANCEALDRLTTSRGSSASDDCRR